MSESNYPATHAVLDGARGSGRRRTPAQWLAAIFEQQAAVLALKAELATEREHPTSILQCAACQRLAVVANARLEDENERLLGSVEVLHEALINQRGKLDLQGAIHRLYYAAHWTPDRDVDARKLWEDVRDAAGFRPGHAPSADAKVHIAEDENERLKAERISADNVIRATLSALGGEPCDDPVILARKVGAELAALKARRCEECAMWATQAGKFAGCPIEYERDAENTAGDPPADFACNRWAKAVAP